MNNPAQIATLYDAAGATGEIFTMLLGAFILGCFAGWLIAKIDRPQRTHSTKERQKLLPSRLATGDTIALKGSTRK